MYWFRFATRCCTSPSCPWLICQNSEPHTGISRFPCAGSAASPRIIELTRIDGYLPFSFFAKTVRSGGGSFRASAAGPPPLASLPWQTAHYVVYISCREAADVALAGRSEMVLCCY